MLRNCLIGTLLVFSLVMLLAAGCGKSGNRTIATVGDYEITTEEFDEYFNRLPMTYATSQEEFNKRREILDSMIVTRLLIQGAYELNIDKVDELARAVAANKNKFLMATLYQTHIASKSEPTEAEIRDYYNHLENRIRASHILVENLDTAQALFQRIKNGENFDQLAFDYSIDPEAKRNKGDLGYLLWGALVDEFQDAAFSMEPGEVSPPIKSQFGYHIIKLVEKSPNENRQDYEDMRESIKNQLIRRKSIKLTEDYMAATKAKYPVAIDTTTFEYVLHKMQQVYPPQILANLPRNDFDVEQLDRNEKELVAATWAGGQVSLMEYLSLLKNVPPNIRPNFDDYDSLASVVFEMKKMDVLTHEALAEGLDQNEDYLKNMRMFKEFNMADIMKNDSIQAPPPPDEAALRQYYEENIDEFTTPAKIHVHEILLSDELKASQLAKEIKSLDQFKTRAAELTERPGKRGRQGDLGFIEQKWYPEIFEVAEKTSVGRIGGPVLTKGKYAIFYVVERIEPEIKDFLDVKRTVNDKLLKSSKNQSIQAWIDNRLKTTRVDINDDVLWGTIEMDKYAGVDSTGS